ncbi:hypothetical protein A1D29_09750 [Pasteurellaceae bacterium Orientalotternb1]|nr:hypothetical protein A1D29_09750 [Pasteurellaceae bacterium Orientalotternb1]
MIDYFTSLSGLFFSEQNQLLLMFISAFVSSTILPGNSEVIFSTLIAKQTLNDSLSQPFALFLSASIGNSLGSLTTYAMARFLPEPKFKTASKTSQWAIAFSQRYGVWTLLFSWLPVVGDVLCGVAGWLRLNIWQSVLFIALGKATRYAVLWWSVATFLG